MFFKKKRDLTDGGLNKNIKALQDGDISAVPLIFCAFTENYNDSKLLAAKSLNETLVRLSYNNIIRIDESMRRAMPIECRIDWWKFNINTFFTPQMSVDERRAVVIFSSFNPNGFIREQAIMMMKNFDFTLPYIILRQNDWAKQVRQAAADAFRYRLSNLCEGEILAALPFMDRLRKGARDSHSESLELFFSSLTAPENEHELKNGLKSSNVRTRKICIDALFCKINPDYQLIFSHLTSEPDPFLRSFIFKILIGTGQKFDWSVEMFLKDKFPVNRILAFQYLLNIKSANADNVAKKLLLDKNAAVRETAKKHIKEKTPEFDFRMFYIENLKDCTVSAIFGIGENGKKEDATIIENYLSNNHVAMVKSAMVSLMKLNREKYSAAITELLNDYRRGVVKTAYNLILKNKMPDYNRIEEIFYAAKNESAKSKCMSILLTASKWQRLIYILGALKGKDKLMHIKATESLNLWLLHFNCSFVSPDKNQITKIKELISGLKGILSTEIIKELFFVLPD